MFTHDDAEIQHLQELALKAERMRLLGESRITGGKPGERVLEEYDHAGVHVVHRPNDEHGVLRISIGRLPSGDGTYCTFRGHKEFCIAAIEDALKAMRKGDA